MIPEAQAVRCSGSPSGIRARRQQITVLGYLAQLGACLLWYQVEVKSMGSGPSVWFESLLHLIFLWTCMNSFTSLDLSFSTCKVGIIGAPPRK